MTAALIEARDLVKTYTSRKGLFAQPVAVRAVDGLPCPVAPATTLRWWPDQFEQIHNWTPASRSGRSQRREVTFEAQLCRVKRRRAGALCARMQLVYQDPLAALDRRLPLLTVR